MTILVHSTISVMYTLLMYIKIEHRFKCSICQYMILVYQSAICIYHNKRDVLPPANSDQNKK